MLRQAQAISLNLRRATEIQALSKAEEEFRKNNPLDDKLNAAQLLSIGLAKLEAGKKIDHYFDAALEKTTDPVLVAECYYGLLAKSSSGVSASNKSQENADRCALSFEYADKCLAECEKFASSNPNEYMRIKSNLLRNRGILYLKLENYKNAIEDFHASSMIAEKSPQLRGFLPAVVAYEALCEGKRLNKAKALYLFSKAEQLYLQFSKDELADSMDYASMFTHKTRVFLLLGMYASAVEAANIAFQMRHDYLVTEKNNCGGIGEDYVTSRMTAIINLRNDAIEKLRLQNDVTVAKPLSQSKHVLFQIETNYEKLVNLESVVFAKIRP